MAIRTKTYQLAQIVWFHVFTALEYVSPDNSRPASWRNPLSDLYEKGKKATPTTYGLCIPMMRGYEARHGSLEVFNLYTKEGEPVKLPKSKRDDWVRDLTGRIDPIFAELIPHVEVCETYIDLASVLREFQIRIFKESDNPLWQGLATTAEKVWEKDPEVGGNMGFRRGGGGALGAIHLLNYDRDRPSHKYEISCQLVEYESEKDREMAHVAENLQKGEGASGYSDADYIAVGVKLARSGGIEADLIKIGMKKGRARKVLPLAKLHLKFGGLNLLRRFAMDAPESVDGRIPYSEGGHVSFGPLDYRTLTGLWKGVKQSGAGPAIEVAETPQEVEDYIKAAMEGVDRQSSALKKDRQVSIAESHACLIVRKAVQAVREGDGRWFDRLEENADDINTLLKGVVLPALKSEDVPVVDDPSDEGDSNES